MSGFLKKLGKGIEKAAHNAANPKELEHLDNIVEDELKDFDRFVNGLQNDGTPLNEEQATELENKKFQEAEDNYERRAHKSTGRKAEDKDDNISVRLRQLKRGLNARKGKIFAKFSGTVGDLKGQAATTLSNCVESLNAFEEDTREKLPLLSSTIESEYASLRRNLDDQINSSFPDGINGLDNYDDSLPDGIPSYKQFVENFEASKAAINAANDAAKEATKAQIKDGFLDDLKAAIAEIDELPIGFLTEEEAADLKNRMKLAVNLEI
jgi:hypothetical protein